MAKVHLSQNVMKERLDTYSLDKRYYSMLREQRSAKFGALSFVIKLLILLMLLMIIISALQGNLKVPSFTSMLEGLQNFDVIPSIPFIDFQSINLGDWTIYLTPEINILGVIIPAVTLSFNWLRNIVSYFLSTFNVVIFVVNGLVSLINFAIFFVRWIFI